MPMELGTGGAENDYIRPEDRQTFMSAEHIHREYDCKL